MSSTVATQLGADWAAAQSRTEAALSEVAAFAVSFESTEIVCGAPNAPDETSGFATGAGMTVGV